MSSMSDGAQPARRRGWGGKVGRRERANAIIKAIRAANGGWVTVRYLLAIIKAQHDDALRDILTCIRINEMLAPDEMLVNNRDVQGSMYRIVKTEPHPAP
jgi:hypothetical protein